MKLRIKLPDWELPRLIALLAPHRGPDGDLVEQPPDEDVAHARVGELLEPAGARTIDGHYIHLWLRDSRGEWKLAIDVVLAERHLRKVRRPQRLREALGVAPESQAARDMAVKTTLFVGDAL